MNEYNEDLTQLDITHMTNLIHSTTKYINTSFEKSRAKKQDLENSSHKFSLNSMKYSWMKPSQEDDPELTYIEDNKYCDNKTNNLELFADIALSYY